MDASAYFRDKKITVMGLGLLGRGVGDARYLAECGAELIVTDLKTREELAKSVEQLESFKNIKFVLGEHKLEDFSAGGGPASGGNKPDLILKAAGVPLDSPYIAEAKKNNIPVRMSADLFAEISGVTCVGVTGTRGKSTVTHMIYEILKSSGKLVLLGGNVRGVSTLALLAEATSEHIAVLELDSWQLQGWGEAKISPNIGVFTTFYPDHLNYYKNDLNAYLADKANIFLNQKPDDTLILGKQCAPTIIEKYGDKIESKMLVVDELKLPDAWMLRVLGVHNRYNAALALAAIRSLPAGRQGALNISDETSRKALENFPGVPGRLEFIREVNGIKIYNDTTSTTPESTIAALESMSGRTTSRHDESGFSQPVILIMGGTDKGLDMGALIARLPEMKRVILLAGNGTDRICKDIPAAPIFDSLADAVTAALAVAAPGDTILFSPAFTSFGMFKNEFDRGDQFNVFARMVPDVKMLKPKVLALAEKLIAECKKQGFDIIISRGFRTIEEQEEYYARGRSKPGNIITNAKGGQSFHNYGAAFDVRPVAKSEKERAELYRKAGNIGMDLGLEWGGSWEEFIDPPHFQFTAEYSIDDFRNGRIDKNKFVA